MRKKKRRKSKHHIKPKSRGGQNRNKFGDNLALICDDCHRQYHLNFVNATPDEIIHHLVTHYWNGQWGWVELALKERKDAVPKVRKKNSPDSRPSR